MKNKELELEKIKHDFALQEIEAKRQAELEVENLKFEHQLQLQRIKSAEIRRTIERKENKDFAENYYK